MNALALAFGLLTRVPVGLPDVRRRDAARAMLLAPLTALPIVLVVVAAHFAVTVLPVLPPLLCAVGVVAAGSWLTRGLHLDGLADTADGLASGRDRAGSLRVMKESDIGPSGVVALVLGLLAQVVCLAALLATTAGTALAALAWFASRGTLAWACHRRVPAASPTGLGSLVAGSVGSWALLLSATALVAVGAVVDRWCGPVVVVASSVAALVVVRRCVAVLGGVTGDVLGATVEVALTAGLVAAVSCC